MIGRRFRPEELYEFVHVAQFDLALERCRLSDDDLFDLQQQIMANPSFAPVIPGTGGIRKMRFAPGGGKRGKRGAFRSCFLVLEEVHVIVLILIYPKSEKDDLSDGQKKMLKALCGRIKQAYAKET